MPGQAGWDGYGGWDSYSGWPSQPAQPPPSPAAYSSHSYDAAPTYTQPTYGPQYQQPYPQYQYPYAAPYPQYQHPQPQSPYAPFGGYGQTGYQPSGGYDQAGYDTVYAQPYNPGTLTARTALPTPRHDSYPTPFAQPIAANKPPVASAYPSTPASPVRSRTPNRPPSIAGRHPSQLNQNGSPYYPRPPSGNRPVSQRAEDDARIRRWLDQVLVGA
eukprot:TRINITY_DN29486_c0_g1_i1.p1 TRINITY_DN29486_c0_g1~~TRINITY_DN29486_c0_g1_i1.p1  ORF type:complete len:222 (+),score=7.92 TRINITY_DN29486_c0_g1_i1:24-668(+)